MVTFESLIAGDDKIAVIGLGYVGLPLAVQLSHHFNVLGYDLKAERIDQLKAGHDRTLEVSDAELTRAELTFSSNPEDLSGCRLMVIAVPTPIDSHRIPDLKPLRHASRTAGRYLKPGSCVVFESTVFPGATEDICVPIIEQASGLSMGTGFTVGYSPERMNPGDSRHRLENIIKIVSGSNHDTLEFLAAVYGRVVPAGIHKASSIKVAEGAKVIENTQRDLNIALMNELAMIFDRIGIDSGEVIDAAATKWNFLPFKPGLVGGHCIGVDPYYLTFKAESTGYHPEMILAGRRINDSMGKFVAEKTVKMLIAAGKRVSDSRVAVLGLTFKENVPDLRNTRVVDMVDELTDYGVQVMVHDPLVTPSEAEQYYGITLFEMTALSGLDAIILAVAHNAYRSMGLARLAALCGDGIPLVIDIKGVFTPQEAADLGISYWRL